ncbi:MAG TPA: ABC transporter permease [Rudaea sp.]|nr:ABC transporter permease [Rudaea sp.]
MPAFGLVLHFIHREIRSRYLGSFSGGLWALFQPLIQLAVYGFVFTYVFKARAPGGPEGPGYVAFLVMALWPWNAFSEALTHANTSIETNAGLIRKVAMPREVLVIAAVAACFLLQGLGFIAIAISLRLFGVPVDLAMLPLALLGFVQLSILALGFGFFLAAVQVFIRDLSAALPQLLMLWMFASPIFYPRGILPPRFDHLLAFNPITHYVEFFRAVLLHSGTISWVTQGLSLLASLIVLAIGYATFRRLGPHFEDFL